MKQEQLQLKFDPNTIDDLGAKLYSTLPPILAELIANGYDAGASEILVEFYDEDSDQKRIVVSDNGAGMTFSEINESYLVVGRKKRESEEGQVDPVFGRPVMGKKGLGKLSFFGVTDKAQISTIKDGLKVIFEMDQNEIRKSQEYLPKYKIVETQSASGTRVELFNVKRDTGFDIQAIKNSISNFFIFDHEFKVFISHDGGPFEEISNETRYQQMDIQFTWDFPNEDFPNDMEITGRVLTTEKPLPKRLRGISLISRKKLVNLPELFPADSSSFFHQYLTGYLEIDFVDEFPEDLISTDRKSLNWESSLLSPLKSWLSSLISSSSLERIWREQRELVVKELIQTNPKVIKVLDTMKIEKAKTDFAKSVKMLAETDIDTDVAIQVASKMTGEYPEFHRQYLTEELQDLVYDHYKKEEYYDAVFSGVKRYIVKLRTKISKQDDNDSKVVDTAFKETDPNLLVSAAFSAYKNAKTGAEITDETKRTLERGNHLLAKAMLAAFRNPLGHQEHEDLSASKIYTAEDCLDALSLLSHLYRRLDMAVLQTS